MTPATNVPWPKPAKKIEPTDININCQCKDLWMAPALLYSPYCLLAHNPSFTRINSDYHQFSSVLTIIKCLFIGPVGPFLHILKMWVLLTQACIKHRHFHTRSYTITQQRGYFPSKRYHMREQGKQSSGPTSVPHLPKNICLEDLGNMAGDCTQQTPAGVASGCMPEA